MLSLVSSKRFAAKVIWGSCALGFKNKILEAWSRMLRMSHAIVSAKYSGKIQVRCVAVWITFPLCASGSRKI